MARTETGVDTIEVDVNDLPGRLAELLARATAGVEVVVTSGGTSVARLTPIPPPGGLQRIGFAPGSVAWMAPDFDDPLPDEFWLGGNP
jgi:prevent-host-death family protein